MPTSHALCLACWPDRTWPITKLSSSPDWGVHMVCFPLTGRWEAISRIVVRWRTASEIHDANDDAESVHGMMRRKIETHKAFF